MGGAAGFMWVIVVILGLAWVLIQTKTVNIGVDFNLWINLLLVLAVLGAAINLIVLPLLGRRSTTRTTVETSGTSAAAPASSTTSQEVVQETQERRAP
jgi:hypothetical protein